MGRLLRARGYHCSTEVTARFTGVPVKPAVEVQGDTVLVTYTRGGRDAYRLLQGPVPRGSLCRAVSQLAGSECTEAGGVMRSTMEESATVAVVRDSTLLVLRDLGVL